jgi:hypothetical protein
MPIDGERFVILIQVKDNPEDIEEKMNPADKESSIQRFIKRTRWRRKKPQYDVGVQEDDLTLQNPDEEWEHTRPGTFEVGEEDRSNWKPIAGCTRDADGGMGPSNGVQGSSDAVKGESEKIQDRSQMGRGSSKTPDSSLERVAQDSRILTNLTTEILATGRPQKAIPPQPGRLRNHAYQENWTFN